MESLTPFLEQIRGIWNDASGAARIGLSALAVACVAIIVGVGVWSSQPEYLALADGLTPKAAADLIARLDAEQIAYELNHSGSAISVPRTQWSRARLLTADIADVSNGATSVPFEEPVLGDPGLNHFRLLRHKEQQLAASISRVTGVETATVHISQPEPSPFIREQEATTASIVLDVKPGHTFLRSQAEAVVAMLSTSVEGLAPENISVVDTRGRLLYTHQAGPANEMHDQFEFRRRLEADLASKAELLLAEMLGHGKSRVRITADVDFTQSQRTETTYDPEQKVKKREKTRSTSRNGVSKSPVGVPGFSSNGANASGAQGDNPFVEKEEENETDYETPSIVDTVREASGTLRRLTVAAMVDLSSDEDGADPPTISEADVEALIQTAVGFDETRGDQIKVVVGEFATTPATSPVAPAGWTWDRIQDLLRVSSLGLASLVALVLGMLIIRRMKPVQMNAEPTAYVTPDRARMLAELSDRAAKDPEAAARIVKAWLGEAEPQTSRNRRATDPPNSTAQQRRAA